MTTSPGHQVETRSGSRSETYAPPPHHREPWKIEVGWDDSIDWYYGVHADAVRDGAGMIEFYRDRLSRDRIEPP